uniref:Uncharacterized protein n=1 Tax=Mycena chlorophos TaxID=658473 RepID=A0ABQ0LMR6_MYCCL|nr:predicted protein [Mycena chlorophos]
MVSSAPTTVDASTSRPQQASYTPDDRGCTNSKGPALQWLLACRDIPQRYTACSAPILLAAHPFAATRNRSRRFKHLLSWSRPPEDITRRNEGFVCAGNHSCSPRAAAAREGHDARPRLSGCKPLLSRSVGTDSTNSSTDISVYQI